MPLGYYKDPEKSATIFVEVDGERYVVAGDYARLEDDGTITLLGRGNVSINTGGEKVFPEEVEAALKSYEDVYDVLVVGVPDERFGQRVAALVQPWEGREIDFAALDTHVREQARRVQDATQRLDRRPGRPRAERQTGLPLGEDVHRGARTRLAGGQCRCLTHCASSSASSTRSSASRRRSTSRRRSAGRAGSGCSAACGSTTPADLEAALSFMDENTDGKPYGVDIVMPAKMPTEGTPKDLSALVPQGHKEFVERTLLKLGVPPLSGDSATDAGVLGWLHSVARSHVDVALGHRISLIANALGSPPVDVIEQAHDARGAGRRTRRHRGARPAARRERRGHRGGARLRGRRAHR